MNTKTLLKKTIFLSIFLVLLICFNNLTYADPYAAPSNLTAKALSSTQIRLAWQDNSSDETGFGIEMSSDGGKTFVYKGAVGLLSQRLLKNFG